MSTLYSQHRHHFGCIGPLCCSFTLLCRRFFYVLRRLETDDKAFCRDDQPTLITACIVFAKEKMELCHKCQAFSKLSSYYVEKHLAANCTDGALLLLFCGTKAEPWTDFFSNILVELEKILLA